MSGQLISKKLDKNNHSSFGRGTRQKKLSEEEPQKVPDIAETLNLGAGLKEIHKMI